MRNTPAALRMVTVVAVLALSSSQVRADTTPSHAATQAAIDAAWQAADKVALRGPQRVALLDQASLALTDDEAFVPAAETRRLMAAMGNGDNPGEIGLITSRRADWFITVEWVQDGYVRDGDAKEWKADTLLESLRSDTERGNTARVARGLPAMDIIGWVEPPAYDALAHRLVWSVSAQDHGTPPGSPTTINYNTYALGRAGYFSLDLVTSSATIATDKDAVRQVLNTLAYVPGKRYQDFRQSTDKVAEYGLAALIGAVAVKKLGLLALGAAFFIKTWKLGVLALAGVTAGVRRWLRGRRAPDQQG